MNSSVKFDEIIQRINKNEKEIYLSKLKNKINKNEKWVMKSSQFKLFLQMQRQNIIVIFA